MIEGVEIDVDPGAVWVRSAALLRVLASAVVGGDLDVTRRVVNMHVGTVAGWCVARAVRRAVAWGIRVR